MTAAIRKKMDLLVLRLSQADNRYYSGNGPSLMSDHQYDLEKKELFKLESEWPDYINVMSPSRRVGYDVSSTLIKRKHPAPMYSLDNALTDYNNGEYDLSAIREWWDMVNPSKVYLDYKFDGLAVDITCLKGAAVSIVTRGDGITGEDVTKTAIRSKAFDGPFNDVSKNVGWPDEPYHIRGEVMLSKSSFTQINRLQALAGKKLYSNPRNAAAGILRSIHDTEFAKYLDFVAYEYLKPETNEWSFLPNVPVSVTIDGERRVIDLPQRGSVFSDLDVLLEAFKQIDAVRDDLPFEIDGLVYKIVDDEDVRVKYGYKTRYPVFMIAHKFPPRETYSVLLDVKNQVGRSGEVTPVGVIKPVQLGGVVVSSPTLNNYNWMKFRKLKPGVRIKIRRAGDVIPEVVGAVDMDDNVPFIPMEPPVNCPSCGSILESENDDMTIKCVNETGCPAQLSRLIEHHTSRLAMNIDGFGSKRAELLVEKGYVKCLSDIYLLKAEDYAKAFNKDGKVTKDILNLMAAIEKAKTVEPARFLYSLGILGVGMVRAKNLIDHFGSFEAFFEADADEMIDIDGIAKETAIKIGYGVMLRRDDVAVMFFSGVKFIEEAKPTSDVLAGQVWVVTGSFGSMTANQVKEKLKSMGAEVKDSVTKDTTDLLVGDSPGGKLKDALAKGIPTRTIDYLLSMEK